MSARRRRRRRLRVTALPTGRPIAKATCGVESSASSTWIHQSGPDRTRSPSRRSRSNASRVRIRSIKRRGEPGPWPGATSARRGRLECSYVHGNRASSPDDAGWAGRCASRQFLRRKGDGAADAARAKSCSRQTPSSRARDRSAASDTRHHQGNDQSARLGLRGEVSNTRRHGLSSEANHRRTGDGELRRWHLSTAPEESRFPWSEGMNLQVFGTPRTCYVTSPGRGQR